MTWRRFALVGYGLGLTLGLGLLLVYGAMEVSSAPTFCGSCHVMTPYYESWQGSSHAGIACVDCHIPPGVTATLRKKYEALSMVTSYFTGSYGSRPWAEVDDAACLECHERRLLVGAELFGEILFDHASHLTELRRGKRLQCTSCHAQIVQGSHITVTPTTCILCHFKGEEPGTGTARCGICHQTPERIVDARGYQFDHGDVTRFGIACESCHTPASPEAGGVPRERCRTCHNDPVRLAEYDQSDSLHRIHVSEHKVECTDCHLEIEHIAPRHLEATRSDCATCHRGGHAPQRSLYAGVSGKGVEPMPDVMYRAGVRCEGCHVGEGDTHARNGGEVACMSCHGPSYGALYARWVTTLAALTSAIREELEVSTQLLAAEAQAELADARANVELVERARAIHNVRYSTAVLMAAHEQINRARTSGGAEPLPSPWQQIPYESRCLHCHLQPDQVTTPPFGKPFDHAAHIVGAGVDCEACHRGHEEREQSGESALRFAASGCDSCHHGDESHECLDCHAGISERTYEVELGDFDHEIHVDLMEVPCETCHGERAKLSRTANPEACTECH